MDQLLHILSDTARDFWGLWLMLLFLGVVFYAYAPHRKAEMRAHARIPMDDETHSTNPTFGEEK